jgi:hypothetical protein
MHMVEHQMIYSPERKNKDYIMNITGHSFYVIQLLVVTIFSVGRWSFFIMSRMGSPLFVLMFTHLCWVPIVSFPWSEAGRAPHPPSVSRPVLGSSGSRQLPISLSGTIKVSTLRGHQYVRTRDEVFWGKEMFSLYFRLPVLCLSEARVPEIDM